MAEQDAMAEHEERDVMGDTALIRAAKAGALDTVGRLLDQGADKEAADKWGRTSLIWAAREGHADVCLLLLEKGAAINTMDMYGNTAHAWATKNTGYVWTANGAHQRAAAVLMEAGTTL